MRGWMSLTLLGMSMALAAACASPETRPPTVSIPVTDVKTLAGKWEGVAHGLTARHSDWFELTLGEDGSYESVIYRQVGVVRGRGRVAVRDGELHWTGERSRGTLWLSHDRDGRRVISFKGELEPGRPVWGDLQPAKR